MARPSSAPTSSATCSPACATWSGGRAGGYERALAGARDAALQDLIEAAKERGADGVIGVDFDYAVLGETNGMMMVTVSGTAIRRA
jgi:uncharacterized protein YbjQ (UPF0145 family)